MARIVILGGTGYAGGHLAAEAAGRGHDVLTVSRSAPSRPLENVEHRSGDVRDEAFLASIIEGADVVVSALSPRGDMAEPGTVRGIVASVARLAQDEGVRLGVVGGAGSLRVAEDGPKFVDSPAFPLEVKDEPRELDGVLTDLRAADDGLDWFFISPGAGFGAFAPGEATGTYRDSGELLLTDENGNSYISGQDLALAIVDEIEQPSHRRAHFGVAY